MEMHHVRIWTDASGERWLAVVILFASDFHYPRWQCSEKVLVQFGSRNDSYIGILACMAVFLGMFLWYHEPGGFVITIYVDNGGVRCNLFKGSFRFPQTVIMVAHVWQLAARCRWGVLVRRLESKANIADGPTRRSWDDSSSFACFVGASCSACLDV